MHYDVYSVRVLPVVVFTFNRLLYPTTSVHPVCPDSSYECVRREVLRGTNFLVTRLLWGEEKNRENNSTWYVTFLYGWCTRYSYVRTQQYRTRYTRYNMAGNTYTQDGTPPCIRKSDFNSSDCTQSDIERYRPILQIQK